ncbi:MAG: hypothetical protein HKN11_18485, partial [Rhizobiales bacterium]|nr:hypothetical protein [Hyphomicrobiales bacterium]
MGLTVLVRVLVLVTFFGCCDVAGAQTLPSIGGGDKKEDKSDDAPPNVIKTDTAEIEASYASWQEQLTALEAKLVELEKADTRSSSEITLLSEKLQIMTGELTEVRMRAEEAKSGPERALNAIGAPPKEKERPEATAIADERQLHQRDLARIEAALTFVRVANARADDLVERLALLGERKFSNWILERRDSLDVLGSTSELTGLADPVRSMRVPDLPEITSLSRGWHVMLSAVALVISAALFLWILPRARAAAAAQKTDALPPRRQIALLRFASAVGSGILPAIICLALAWFCVVTLATSGTVWIAVLVCGLVGLATYMGFYKILHAALAPKNQILRIPNLNDEAAQRLNGLLRALCALVAVCCAIYLAVTFAQRTPDSVV